MESSARKHGPSASVKRADANLWRLDGSAISAGCCDVVNHWSHRNIFQITQFSSSPTWFDNQKHPGFRFLDNGWSHESSGLRQVWVLLSAQRIQGLWGLPWYKKHEETCLDSTAAWEKWEILIDIDRYWAFGAGFLPPRDLKICTGGCSGRYRFLMVFGSHWWLLSLAVGGRADQVLGKEVYAVHWVTNHLQPEFPVIVQSLHIYIYIYKPCGESSAPTV